MSSLSFISGFMWGLLNAFFMYKLYGYIFFKHDSIKGWFKKTLLGIFAIFKTLILFFLLYALIVVFKAKVVYLLSGFILSLIVAVFFICYINRNRSN